MIREGKRGLFGLGGEDAIVRVTKHDNAPPAVAPGRRGERRDRGRAGERERPDVRDQPDDRGGSGDGEGEPEGEGRPRRRRGRRRGGGGGGGGDGNVRSEGGNVRGEGGNVRGERGGARGEGGGARGEGGGRGPGPATAERGRPEERQGPIASEPTRVPGAPDDPPRQPAEDAEDEIDFAGRTLRDLLMLLGLEGTEIAARGPETPGDGVGRVVQVFDISGETEEASDELGLLIGRRGETLGSLQYLLNVMVSRRSGDQNSVFGVDIEGYRRRREESLVEMAQRVAAEVRETGDVITLESMPAAERRIVHLTLSEEPGVVTESVGRGSDRQVEVLPGERDSEDEEYDDEHRGEAPRAEAQDEDEAHDEDGEDEAYDEDNEDDEDEGREE